MITLPPPRHSSLKSFWLVMTLLSGLFISGLLWVLDLRWFPLGIILPLVLVLPGLRRPLIMYIPYRIWIELVRRFASCVRPLLTGICFYLVLMPIGLTRSSVRLERLPRSESLWEARGTLPPTAYGSQSHLSTGKLSQKGWVYNYLSWAFKSGNFWAGYLLPFLLLLSALETDDQGSVPDDIYTLF